MRLTKSRDDIMVSGVLAGLGEYFNVDPTLIRIGVALLGFFTPFPVIPLYIIGAVLIPNAPKKENKPFQKKFSSNRSKRKGFDFRNYEEVKAEEKPFSKVNDIEEDDWSDF